MDLVYTNSRRIDQGVLQTYSFDLSFGTKENDFEMTIDADMTRLEYGAIIYMENSEYGGMIDGMRSTSNYDTLTYIGRTFHGILNSKVIEPDTGDDHLIVSGEVRNILITMIKRLNLQGLFGVSDKQTGITIKSYKFARYCKAYDGLKAMLASVDAKLKMTWENQKIVLSAEPIVDYTKDSVDNDTAKLSIELHNKKVNHLICLGSGELADRLVIHLYADARGNISEKQTYFNIDEITDVYDYGAAQDSDELLENGIKHFKELRCIDAAYIDLQSSDDTVYDIGDIVGATDVKSKMTAAMPVTQKIVKIINGVIIIEYEIGGEASNG